MNKKEFTAVLQIALWKNEGMSELEIRQYISNLVSDKIIVAGLKLCEFLNGVKQ